MTDNERAIPAGYMTVGEIAKKMGVTVRTLQYYDREGLFPPSAQSEGGRRLYTDKDMVRLHQILSLRHLGFSLSDIKNRLIPLDTPGEVADVLSEQANMIREKIASLKESLREIEALRGEVVKMQSVDFKKYADIIVNLQMKNEYYWLIKHFDDQTLDHIRTRFDKESGQAFMKAFTRLQDRAIQLLKEGVPPEGEQGKALAREFWQLITEFTGGDKQMLTKLVEIGDFKGADEAWRQKQEQANAFLEPALGAYFAEAGLNPFGDSGEETK